MRHWFKIPSLKKSNKDMYDEATYHGKDDGGNFIYVPKWVESLFPGNKGNIDYDMSTVGGKQEPCMNVGRLQWF